MGLVFLLWILIQIISMSLSVMCGVTEFFTSFLTKMATPPPFPHSRARPKKVQPSIRMPTLVDSCVSVRRKICGFFASINSMRLERFPFSPRIFAYKNVHVSIFLRGLCLKLFPVVFFLLITVLSFRVFSIVFVVVQLVFCMALSGESLLWSLRCFI